MSLSLSPSTCFQSSSVRFAHFCFMPPTNCFHLPLITSLFMSNLPARLNTGTISNRIAKPLATMSCSVLKKCRASSDMQIFMLKSSLGFRLGCESRSALEQEKEAHKAFAQERGRHFGGRGEVRKAIKDYLESDDT